MSSADVYDPDDINSTDLPFVIGKGGSIQRLGLLAPDPTFNVMAPAYEDSAQPILEDDEIRRLATREDKTPRRVIFQDPEWQKQTNQRSAGSCNGWAGASGLAKTIYLNDNNALVVPLSGSYVYSWINRGRDAGSPLDEGMAELAAHGAPRATTCSWDKIYRKQTAAFDAEAEERKGATMWFAKTKQGFRSGIALGFMGIVCLHWDNRLANFSVTTDKIAPVNTSGIGNHAIHCQDMVYLNGTETFDCGNSHGLGSGNQGYLNLVWEHFARPFTVHKFYLIGSANVQQNASAALDSIAHRY